MRPPLQGAAPRPSSRRTGPPTSVVTSGSLFFSVRRLQAEADTPHGLNQLELGRVLELTAQIAHMHVDDVALGVEVQVPHLLEQVGAADDLLGAQQEVLKQLELFGRELELLSLHAYLMLQPVELDGSVHEELRAARPTAPHQRAHAGE